MSMTTNTRTQVEVTLDTDTVDTIAVLEAESAAHGAATRAQLSWTESDTGLWVAAYGGYYGGTVDKQGSHYFVSDTFGQYVGDFGTLEEAQSQLAARLHVMLPGVIRSV